VLPHSVSNFRPQTKSSLFENFMLPCLVLAWQIVSKGTKCNFIYFQSANNLETKREEVKTASRVSLGVMSMVHG